MKSESLEISGLTFEIRRSARRNTVVMTVDRDGALLVHSPLTTESGELRAWIIRKLLWVHRKLALRAGVTTKSRPPEFVTGESFSFLGRTHQLRLVKGQKEPLHFDGVTFLLRPTHGLMRGSTSVVGIALGAYRG